MKWLLIFLFFYGLLSFFFFLLTSWKGMRANNSKYGFGVASQILLVILQVVFGPLMGLLVLDRTDQKGKEQ